ncbi:hypothetical protein MRX96_042207 [Rhipicephalus microplus]
MVASAASLTLLTRSTFTAVPPQPSPHSQTDPGGTASDKRIDRNETLAVFLGLSLNPSKCMSFHMVGSTPAGMCPTVFTVSGNPISVLRNLAHWRFYPLRLQNEAEEAQAGRADDLRVEATDKDWSFWPKDSSFGVPEEKDTSSSAETDSQFGGSQATTRASDNLGPSPSHSEKVPCSPLTSSTESKPGKPPGMKLTSSQMTAGRRYRKHAADLQDRRAAAETSCIPHDHQPPSPISQILKQGRDPCLRNPLHQLTHSSEKDDKMELGRRDLKRPHHSSSSSADDLGKPRKQPATDSSRSADPPGPVTPDL